MKIAIDISQLAYSNTGVANYLYKLVNSLLDQDAQNEYILFFSSFRGALMPEMEKKLRRSNVTISKYKFPPLALSILWNKLHIFPIDSLIGRVDIFISSDWTEPPIKSGKKMTILYDLVVIKHPEESTDKIVQTQKRKLEWVKKESDGIICISESTKQDAVDLLGISSSKLRVIYPGV